MSDQDQKKEDSVDKILIDKNETERFQLSVDAYGGGSTFVNLRLWFQADDGFGQWTPSKKGLVVSLKNWPRFKQAINDLDVPEPPEEVTENEDGSKE